MPSKSPTHGDDKKGVTFMNKNIIDVVMMIASILFGYSLIPTVLVSFKTKAVGIAWQTLVLTSTGMIMFLPCYVCLHCWLAFITSLVSTSCWLILLAMKGWYYVQHRHQ
jgi:hypothetical protein